jgi:LmbE family N-acetylglucosaminyl deacetylase
VYQTFIKRFLPQEIMKKPTILVFCAHNDDQVIGAGGTLAKYADTGARIKSIIFSFGESSHPHLKSEVIIKTRIEESLTADKIIGGAGVAYLGLKEGKFIEECETKKIKDRLRLLIKQEKPDKVFTHSLNDHHPDHRAVARIIESLLPDIPCSVYTFEIWTPFRLKNRYSPKLVEDISKTFSLKMEAIRAHRSQKIAIANLILSVFFKAILHGISQRCRYAEVFDKIQ